MGLWLGRVKGMGRVVHFPESTQHKKDDTSIPLTMLDDPGILYPDRVTAYKWYGSSR